MDASDQEIAELQAKIVASKKALADADARKKAEAKAQAAARMEDSVTIADRGIDYRFKPGNKGGGNVHAGHVSKLRSAMMTAITAADMQDIFLKLIDMAKKGNLEAIKEVFQRTVGKPVEIDLMDQIERLEQAVSQLQQPASHPMVQPQAEPDTLAA